MVRSQRKQRALLICHFSYIYLGDLERYRAQYRTAEGEDDSTQWSVAHLWYQVCFSDCSLWAKRIAKSQSLPPHRHRPPCQRAARLAPRNGKSYNQLAVLARQREQLLETIYYYIRSIAVKQPIMTARDSLVSIFEKVCECQA